MSVVRRFKRRLLGRRTLLRRHAPHQQFVISYDVGGKPVKYLVWDYLEIWRWTKSLSRATRFPSYEQAEIEARGTSMAYKHKFTIRVYNN